MNKNEKWFMITDPCYVMGSDYDKLGKKMEWEMEKAKFPYKCKNGVVIHRILGTPSGDGSFKVGAQVIAVDSGQLCLAEVPKDIYAEQKFGVVVSDDGWEQTRKFYYYLSKF